MESTPSSSTDIRRRIDAFALVISVVGLAGTWLYVWQYTPEYRFVLYTLPVLGFFNMMAALVALQGRAVLPQFERVVFYVLYTYMAVTLLYRTFFLRVEQDLPSGIQLLFVLLVVITGCLVLQPRRAVIAATLLFLLEVVTSWSRLLLTGASDRVLLATAVEQALTLAIIGLMLTLTWLRIWWGQADAERGELVQLAHTDLLTELPNRRGVYDLMQETLKRVSGARGSEAAFALVITDLDSFKGINDEHGHVAGDEVLKRFAALLREEVRDHDIVGRWGGEEFVVVLPRTRVVEGAVIAERLRARVASSVLLPNSGFPGGVTASFGVAEWQEGDSFDQLLARADRALYRAKSQGKNCVVIEEGRAMSGEVTLEVESPRDERL